MPIAKIEVRRKWLPEQQQFLIQALHAAMLDALKIPERDKQIRFVEHCPEHFAVPPDASENYTLIELSMFTGRSIDAKRNLSQGIVKRYGEIGIEQKDIFIVLNEIPKENCGIRGGVPASEVDLGFKVNV